MDVPVPLWACIVVPIATLLIGAVAAFFIAMWYFRRQQQKNPPINEAMIRAMMRQMGRTPSEAQVRAIMNSMNAAGPKKGKK